MSAPRQGRECDRFLALGAEPVGTSPKAAAQYHRRREPQRDQAIGSTCEYLTCSSAKLDSIDAMPSTLVSFCLRNRS